MEAAGEEAAPEEEEIPHELKDNDDGSYSVTYTVQDETPIKIDILFKDEKEDLVPIRGSPFYPTFTTKGKPADNLMTGAIMNKFIQREQERIMNNLVEMKKCCRKDDKDIKDVKTLLGVKEATEGVIKNTDLYQLEIDQLDEALQLFQRHRLTKDAQIKAFTNINKQWTEIQKMAKDVKKEIEKDVNLEKDKNNRNITNLEEDIHGYTADLKKKKFYLYNSGFEVAMQSLDACSEDIKEFTLKIDDLGGNARGFGNPE